MARYFWYLKIAMWRIQRNLLRWKIYEMEKFFKILKKSILMARYFLIFKDSHVKNTKKSFTVKNLWNRKNLDIFWYLKIAMWRTQRNLLRWKIYEIEKIFKILKKSILMTRYFLYLKIAMWRTQWNQLQIKKFLKHKSFSKDWQSQY